MSRLERWMLNKNEPGSANYFPLKDKAAPKASMVRQELRISPEKGNRIRSSFLSPPVSQSRLKKDQAPATQFSSTRVVGLLTRLQIGLKRGSKDVSKNSSAIVWPDIAESSAPLPESKASPNFRYSRVTRSDRFFASEGKCDGLKPPQKTESPARKLLNLNGKERSSQTKLRQTSGSNRHRLTRARASQPSSVLPTLSVRNSNANMRQSTHCSRSMVQASRCESRQLLT